MGFAFILIAAFNPSAGTAWTNFRNSIQGFPVFNNPFNSAAGSTDLLPVAPALPYSAPTVGCLNYTYYVCLQSIDQTSYVKLQFVNDINQCFINGTNPPDRCGDAVFKIKGSIGYRSYVLGARYNFYCRSTDPNNLGHFAFFISNTNENTTYTCPYSTQFQGMTFPSSVIRTQKDPNNNYWSANFASSWQVEMRVCGVSSTCDPSFPNSGPFEVTAVTISVDWQEAAATCGSFDVACETGRIADAVFKSVQFIINGVIFIGQILGYLVNLIVQFFALFGYFFAVGGLPQILQDILIVLFIGLTLFVIIAILGKVRGTGNTG